ncbi:uncharacterized protein LOC107412785 [Ziziphus jujuba]|uniref:Uncharacterized protein LOC107412785 n=1 Tax=Ziziphus jujuba TaxID=326968 RepID=A0ABM3ID46_ZIZJJ|nr:uncharacterized protein LOC107412785 [Ziziphus jujuba]
MDGVLYNAAINGLSDHNLFVNVDKNRSHDQNNTILHIAAKSGNLQQHNIKEDHLLHFLYKQNNEGNTSLHIAAKLGHLDTIKILVEMARKTDVEQNKKLLTMENNEKDTALHEAVRHNHLEVVKLLIEEDPNLAFLVNDFGRLVLKQIQALTLEQADDFGWTPLHYAAHIGNEKLVEGFLKKDSKSLPFSRNKEGMSALHIAAKKGHNAVMKVLMKRCPEVCELLDNNGRTALHIAVESRDEMAVKFFLERAMAFQDLINLKDKKGNTALHVAATIGDFHILKSLTNDSRIDKGATNKDKETFVDIILSNKELQDTEMLKIMVNLEIEIVLPPRSEQKVDTRKTNEAESKEKKKDKIQIEEDEAGCKQQTNEAESKEKKKDEIQA